ncbi:hypothetical protein GCM10020295_78640 [Streptomyces cinereospinus]
MTSLSGSGAVEVLRTLNQGSLWSAVAPAALVRYCTVSPPAAVAVPGRAARAVAPRAVTAAVARTTRSLVRRRCDGRLS